MDPVRSPLPPVAQFLAEAALQRQSSLLGLDRAQPVVASPLPGSPPPLPPLPVSAPPGAAPLPVPADKASISAQARGQLGAGFDPRGAAAALPSGGRATSGLPLAAAPLPGAAVPAAAASATAPVAAAWPAAGLGAPVLRMVSTLVQQLTANAVPQRVVAAQPWPLALAQALESGSADRDAPPLQTWLVRQGSVQTSEGPRGFALTLRVPVPWLAAQAAVPSPSTAQAPLQAPFTGPAQSLQSGVFALVLQGAEGPAARTSALLVLDFQPHLAATVYGRDMLQARLDPWTQMAVLQASGQVPRDEEKDRARNGASGLCETLGCPYERRAACAQPFCAALRWVDPVGPPAPLA